MNKIKIGIVEDEDVLANSMSLILNKLGYDTSKPAESYSDAIKMIENERPDLVLLDIQLFGDKDGIDVAETINKDFKIPFIFLTANVDKFTLERAKKVFPPAYLIKPFKKEDLYSAIEICLYNFYKETAPMDEVNSYSNKDSFFIKDGYYFHKVLIQDIYYMESDHVYINIYTTSKKITVRASLNNYIENFNKDIFFRVHRSYAVNVNKIDSINSDHVMVNGSKIPITKTNRDALMQRLRVV